MRKLLLEKLPSIPMVEKISAANRSRLSKTEVDHSPEGTRGQGHFLVWRDKPAMHELRRGEPFPDQYECGNLGGMGLFSTLLS